MSRPEDFPFMNAAFDLAEFGFSIFPLAPESKIPIKGSRGVHDATRDEDKILEWWTQCPRANVAIACGEPSGIVVVDIDPGNGGDQSFMEILDKGLLFPRTLTAISANGGRHLYYRWHPDIKNSSKILGPGIDVQSTGRAITASPSIVRNKRGGLSRYYWEVDGDCLIEPELIPDWLIDRYRRTQVDYSSEFAYSGAVDVDSLAKWLINSGSVQGDRNHRLYWTACRAAEAVAKGNATRMLAERQLLDAARRIGLTVTESVATIASAFNRKP